MSNIVSCCGVCCNNEFREIFSMDGFFTTYNESASGVTAPVTVFDERQIDTRNAIAATNESDGASWL